MIRECPECGDLHDPTPCRETAAECDCCRSILGQRMSSEINFADWHIDEEDLELKSSERVCSTCWLVTNTGSVDCNSCWDVETAPSDVKDRRRRQKEREAARA